MADLLPIVFPVLLFWLAALVIGWSAVPIAYRLLPTLPDRGLAFAKPLGLLLAGYGFWLGVTVGLVPNSTWGAATVVIILAAAGIAVAYRSLDDLREFLRERASLVLGLEALFLVGLAAWALYRSFTPNIESAGGEKYMEMAFINAVLGSESFPPLDPWLSGFAISYYYFGYVQSAMLIHLTGVVPSVAFNLMVPLTMGLTLVAAFGIGYDLVGLGRRSTRAARVVTGALTALLLPLMGSLAGALEVAFLRGLAPARFFQWLDVRDLTPAAGSCGGTGSGFGTMGLLPERYIWWWRGSRIIHDLDPNSGVCHEIIHEFPFFSFMLGDVHPHVLALPYVVTVMAIALAVLAGALDGGEDRAVLSGRRVVMALVVGALGFMNTWDLPTFGALVVLAYGFRLAVRRAPKIETPPPPADLVTFVGAVLGVSVIGWKFVPYVLELLRHVPPDQQPASSRLLLTAAIALAAAAAIYSIWSRATSGDATARRAVELGRFTVWFAGLGVLFYLPFYIGLSSQAEGVGVVDIRTRLPQWLVHFGVLFFLAVSLIVASVPRRRLRIGGLSLLILALVAGGIIGALWLGAVTAIVLLLAIGAAAVLAVELWRGGGATVDDGAPSGDPAEVEEGPGSIYEAEAEAEAVGQSATDELALAVGDTAADELAQATGETTADELAQADNETAAVVLAQATGETAADDLARADDETATDELARADDEAEVVDSAATGRLAMPSGHTIATVFALTCVAVGLALPLVTEFVFLRDLFGRRMNSIFKLYYQAWALLSIGGGFAVYAVWRRSPRWLAAVWTVPAILLLAAGTVYPLLAVYDRTNHLQPSNLTLDGLAYWEKNRPEDLEAAFWLRDNAPPGSTILEAYGGAYGIEGRISMATGLPAVLGWEGHEHQWRGTREEIDPRKSDIERLYKSTNESEWRELIEKYGVDYVVVSDEELSKFTLSAADEDRYRRWMAPAFETQSGRLVIYEP